MCRLVVSFVPLCLQSCLMSSDCHRGKDEPVLDLVGEVTRLLKECRVRMDTVQPQPQAEMASGGAGPPPGPGVSSGGGAQPDPEGPAPAPADPEADVSVHVVGRFSTIPLPASNATLIRGKGCSRWDSSYCYRSTALSAAMFAGLLSAFRALVKAAARAIRRGGGEQLMLTEVSRRLMTGTGTTEAVCVPACTVCVNPARVCNGQGLAPPMPCCSA